MLMDAGARTDGTDARGWTLVQSALATGDPAVLDAVLRIAPRTPRLGLRVQRLTRFLQRHRLRQRCCGLRLRTSCRPTSKPSSTRRHGCGWPCSERCSR
jgi:hypothetical protein